MGIRVVLNVDIPQLSFEGIKFATECFSCLYSLQVSSRCLIMGLPFDADGFDTKLKAWDL